MSKYFITPNYYIALNPKVGSSTFARLFIRAFYPDKELSISSAYYPEGKHDNNMRWQFFCPTTNNPIDKPVIIPIRHPVDRFISAMSELGLNNIDLTLDSLESQTKIIAYVNKEIQLSNDPHFNFQSSLLVEGNNYLFKFPEHLQELINLLAINSPIPIINPSKDSSYNISEIQIERIETYYSQDLLLYNSIIEPNTTYYHHTIDPNELKPLISS